jgi:hypothetical protein
MRMMTRMKLKLLLGMSMLLLLAAGPSAVVLAQDGSSNDLSKEVIIKKSQEAYASLSTYSDEGKVVATMNGYTTTTAFTTRMGRPNLYRIEWKQSTSSPAYLKSVDTKSPDEAVWSAGEGNFLDIGSGAQQQESRLMALSRAVGSSGGATATVPAMFFKIMCEESLCRIGTDFERQADEKIGEVDCYVFMSSTQAGTQTVWIGKQDYLFRKIRYIQSAESFKESLDRAAKLIPPHEGNIKVEFTPITSVETHSNIVVNQKFSKADFVLSKVQ